MKLRFAGRLRIGFAWLVVVTLCSPGLSKGQYAGAQPAHLDSSSVARRTSTLDTVKAKSPRGAMIRSIVFPGWGQWYNDKKLKAGLAFGAEMGLIANAVYQNQLAQQSSSYAEAEFYRDNRSLSLWWLGFTILLSMGDAYVDAHLFDFDESPDLAVGVGAMPGKSQSLMHVGLRFKL